MKLEASHQMTVDNDRNIYLEALTEEHVTQTYIDWLNDPETVQFTEQRFTKNNRHLTLQYVRKSIMSEDELMLAILIEKTHIGNIKIGPINKNHHYAHISYFIGDKNFRGMGIATQTIKTVLEFCFSSLSLNKVCAQYYSNNHASGRVLEKCGFIIEGRRKNQFVHETGMVDEIMVGIESKTFKNRLLNLNAD